MPSEETYAVTAETFESVNSCWLNPGSRLKWDCPFVLPAWLRVWWDFFGAGLMPYLRGVRQGGELIGFAPLVLHGEKVSFMGSVDVCDYLDFIVAPGKESQFFRALIEHLKQQGVTHLDLGHLRHDSTVLTALAPGAESLGCEFSCHQEEVSLELDLPATWEGFLFSLTGKERHEVRRKFRRLEEAASIEFRVLDDTQEIMRAMDTFLTLFRLSRPEKAAFMTLRMAAFFRSLAETMAELKILKLFFLDLDRTPAAAALCFDYEATVYLYNSGHDPRFRGLSAGLLGKVFSIRESIRRGRKKYDFLKGAETYKYRLGGRPVPLYRCQIELRGEGE